MVTSFACCEGNWA